ncbi:type VI secretion system contractile sheath small subunit [Marinospirillum sp.]|uniref:type VI secretion system contractile sheath small subunit n=1 Tax=Marinospirillum sp. TaxID=2183934 RepID=UPI0028702B01|nr:type VI secretion system contractile sheath small subunit [Marinospirillum sp.]MDR9467450.1 type VI secretion system contractile sheath small subunit [Marinospirillum sp.]
MASKSHGASVAPKERINICYRPATGDAKAQVELPFKVLVLGQFRTGDDPAPIQERETQNINRQNFDEVMAAQGLQLNFSVPNHLNETDEELSVELKPQSLKDLEPDQLTQAIPELQKTLELREALKALKGPLGNTPTMRKTIQVMLEDDGQRKKLMSELGLSTKGKNNQGQADSQDSE